MMIDGGHLFKIAIRVHPIHFTPGWPLYEEENNGVTKKVHGESSFLIRPIIIIVR